MTSEYKDAFLNSLEEFAENFDDTDPEDMDALDHLVNLLDENQENDPDILQLLDKIFKQIKTNSEIYKGNISNIKKEFETDFNKKLPDLKQKYKRYYRYNSLVPEPDMINFGGRWGRIDYTTLPEYLKDLISYRVLCPQSADHNFSLAREEKRAPEDK